jgi:hypothetical protein
MRWFRKLSPVIGALVGFLVVAAVLCLFLGPTGILYAVGFEVLHLLTFAFAAILDPKTYSKADLRLPDACFPEGFCRRNESSGWLDIDHRFIRTPDLRTFQQARPTRWGSRFWP